MATIKTTATRLLLGVLALGLAGTLSLAETQSTMVITARGDLFQVEEVLAESEFIPTSLRFTVYRASGEVRTRIIRHTSDSVFDTSPSLALDPDTGLPVLVWSRHNGTDYDIVLSNYEGRSWGAPITLASTRSNEIQPKAFTAPGEGLHVVWAWPGEQNSFGYGMFRTATGIAVRGPHKVTPFVESRRKGARQRTQQGGNPFAEGGFDEPGSGITIPPTDGDDSTACDNTNRPCHDRGSGGVVGESGAVLCDNRFTVTVQVNRQVCVLTSDDDGWSQYCYPRRVKLDGVKQAMKMLAGSTCEP